MACLSARTAIAWRAAATRLIDAGYEPRDDQKQEQFCRGYAAVSASGSPDRRRRPTIPVSKPGGAHGRRQRLQSHRAYRHEQ